jgi:hypothetical protein
MITNYNNYINENISNVNKEYTEKIYSLFVNNGYGKYIINFNNPRLKLMNVSIEFVNKDKLSYFDDNDTEIENLFGNYILSNVCLYFSGFSLDELKSKISHELNHIQEYYDKLLNDKLKSTHNIINHSLQIIRDDNKFFGIFCDIIYNTTDDELNSKLNEIYYFLKDFKNENKDELRKELINSKVYSKIEEIKELNFEKLAYGLINKTSTNEMVELINKFNKLFLDELKNKKVRHIKTYNFLKNKVFNDKDTIEYFNKWESIIKNKFNKWDLKLDRIIEQVIIDLKSNENYININYG